MIDLHSHILWGVDDGPRTRDGSVDIARAAVEDGISIIAATPHVRDDHPTDAETMESRVAELRDVLEREGIPLDVRTGGEIAIDRLPSLDEDELRRFGLGGNPSFLLLEFPYYGWPLDLGDRVFELRQRGVTPVIAHPERSAEVQRDPERLARLVRAGALVQLTAASLDGRLGRTSRATALQLLELEIAHLVASDAHAPSLRAIGMTAAAEAVGDDTLAQWLTVDVPRAILDGASIPRRPETAQLKAKRSLLPWRR